MAASSGVSVVIPNYNRGHLIGQAIASALEQRGADVEVLVCDDGSSDDSEAVVRAFEDPRVRWLPGPRSGGPSAPRNRGVAAASTEWVAFLDSDDSWLPGKLEAQLDELRSSSARMCSTNAYRRLPDREAPEGMLYESLPPTISLRDQLAANLVVTSSVLVSRDELRRTGGFPEARGHGIFEDYALWLRVAQRGPIRALDAPYVNYRDDATTSVRGTMGLELVCTANALRDFTRWRRQQRPRIRTSPVDRVRMGRQLAGLFALRAMLTRSRVHS